jgi:hypothetical protein
MEILLGLIISLLALWILARFVIAVFSGIAGIFGGQSHKSNSNDSTLPQSFGNTSASRHGTDEDDLRSFPKVIIKRRVRTKRLGDGSRLGSPLRLATSK